MTGEPQQWNSLPVAAPATDETWHTRLRQTLRRNREIVKFRMTNIPYQGIVFEEGTAIDGWRYPDDVTRVRDRYI
jgi:hypothetical protein